MPRLPAFIRKERRRQEAQTRARRIARFRKGKPKTPCYRCGYDLYGTAADVCPECGAACERDAPWWRDGRAPLWLPLTLAAVAALVVGAMSLESVRETVIGWSPDAPTPGATMTRTILSFALGFGGLALLAASFPLAFWRTRARRSRIFRGAALAATAALVFAAIEIAARF